MQDRAAILAHCDWSMRPEKRWMASSVRRDNCWFVTCPELVGETSTLFKRLRLRSAGSGSLLIGFDFPIGLPVRYGYLTGFRDFRQALDAFGGGDWSDWYRVAEHRDQISVHRPFYPMRPGGTKRAHLLEGLGVSSGHDLLRLCDRATDQRQAACMIFWTLGGNQVGKAAISGWREVIAPNRDEVGLWPFDGTLSELVRERPVVLAETYPGDAYGQIGIPRSLKWSKRKQAGRKEAGKYLLDWLMRNRIKAATGLECLIEDGFGSGPEGEDQFDALAGLFAMVDVVDGRRADGVPDIPAVRTWEGWILGQRGA